MMDLTSDSHDRVIVHVDVDCFYAQVETLKNPELADVPLGIQQKNIVVTCNYVARESGVTKCMLISEARKACPELVLVKGEDLHDYRQISYKVTSHLQKYSQSVERLGLDENYIDITDLVRSKITPQTRNLQPIGNVFGTTNFKDECDCGCFERLTIGSTIAEEIRDSIRREFKLTTCAGIAHNKLLAKLVGSVHKPNQQTVLFPNNAIELLSSLGSVGKIPGVGRVAEESLAKENIKTVIDLQNADFKVLKRLFGEEKSKFLQNLSFGSDNSPVKSTGKPLSIGLEDSCKAITAIGEIKSKLTQLLTRLMILVGEDGRIPRTIKVTVRILDGVSKISHKESKQSNVTTSLFCTKDNKIGLSSESKDKLMIIIMNLIKKIIDTNRPYNITLLGLSFTKFLDRMTGKSSISSFFQKNVEVQSITNIEHKTSDSNLMDYSTTINGYKTDGSDSDYEPSPKKSKQFSALIARRKFMNHTDCPSPSKLNVADLHLGNEVGVSSATTSHNNNGNMCPPNVNLDVFKELPMEIQEELWENFRREKNRESKPQTVKPKMTNTLLNYFVKNY